MKVTHPDVIKTGEKDLIDSIKEDLDWDAIRVLVAEGVRKTTFRSNGGEIVVHEGEIAFKIDVEVRTSVSLFFDRQGNYIKMKEIDASEEGGGKTEAGADINDSQKRSETDDSQESLDPEPEVGMEYDNEMKKNSDSEEPDDLEDSVTEDLMAENSVTEDSVTEDSVSEDFMAEDSVTEDFMAEDSVTEDFMTEDSVTEDFMVEDSVTEDSMIEDSVIEGSEELAEEFERENGQSIDEDIMQDFEDVLSFSGDNDHENTDEDIESLLKESRDFWENRKK
ncbi:hypothetical protein [Desulfamplus magnetovallimortis]|uniref:hypothetical protein n=1 Tax=Desulfamplus magnetovallimortis TaxID=1246637 RepID=UPI00111BBFBA|nr:hypothetical protein [Desulfamplus magnetovallimortis]